MINLFHPYVTADMREAVDEVLHSRFIGQGPKVEQFEEAFAKRFGLDYAVSVNSGSSALETAYDLVGLEAGDEVITTPLTCTATNLPLVRRGIKIIWADIDQTLCIDPTDVQRKITAKTKAIIQVHLGGLPAKVHELSDLERTNPHTGRLIPIISDAAQALGIFTGTFTCCSFQAIKHLTTIDGGMFVTQSKACAKQAKLLRWFGIDREAKIANHWQSYTKRAMTFDIEMAGWKRHMHDVSAAMGIAGLISYDAMMAHRATLFNLYRTELDKILGGPKLVDTFGNTHWLCTVLVDNRDEFAQKMFEADIDTNTVQTRNDVYKIFGGKRADLPVMNMLEHNYISLPLHMNMTEQDVLEICSVVKQG